MKVIFTGVESRIHLPNCDPVATVDKKKGSPQAASMMPSFQAQRPFDRSFWIAANCAIAAAISAWAFA